MKTNEQYKKDVKTGNLVCKVCGLEKDSYVEIIRHRHYTVKQWKKFDKWAERIDGNDITWQEVLLRKYDVILTDHTTKKEKLFKIMDKFNIENLNKGITKFNKGVESFSKSVEAPKGKRKNYDYSALFSQKSPKKSNTRRKKKQKKKELTWF